MNVNSIQAANLSQRVANSEALAQANPRVSTTQASPNKLQVEKQRGSEGAQEQLSVQEAVKRLENFVSIARADISFSIDEASGMQVVKITDRESKEVIRQFPSDEAIRIAQALDKLQGLFVKDRV